jgi:nitrogen fixation protein FixH
MLDMATMKSNRTFTGWHMLALMIGFFGIVIGVNLFMAISATRTWTGLVVENSYVASQEFNSKLAIARQREAAGWQGGLAYESGILRFSLTGADAEPLPLEEVEVHISRPIGMTGDQRLELTRAADGSFVSEVELESGVWNAAIVGRFTDEPDYEHHARLLVQ